MVVVKKKSNKNEYIKYQKQPLFYVTVRSAILQINFFPMKMLMMKKLISEMLKKFKF